MSILKRLLMAPESSPLETIKILLVDDDPGIINCLTRALRDFELQGFEIISASGAQEAQAIIKSGRICTVISDQNMIGMSGVELMAWVADNYPEVKRVLCTGSESLDLVMDAINKCHVYAFIVKPFDNEQIVKVVGETLDVQIAPR